MSSSEEIRVNKELRRDLNVQLEKIKSINKSRERAITITKIQESIMWLGMDLRRLNDLNPYPESYNPSNSIVQPKADELKM